MPRGIVRQNAAASISHSPRKSDMAIPLRVEQRGATALVILDRAAALNAVNSELREALIAAVTEANSNPQIRAVVLAGAGERAFCSGQDLDEARSYSADEVPAWLTRQHAMYQAVRDLDKPCIAALAGVTAGAGFQIALCCDLRVGYPELKIGQPEIRAGLASIVGSYMMTLHIGLAHNIELSLGAKLLSGTRAYELGLVNELVPRREVLERALALASELAALPPTAIRLTKRRLRELSQPGFDAALEAAKAAQREAYASGEPQAAMQRFFDERAARRR
jgi:enoyl-CoA hydratase